jgi:Flp pilus assembly protein CpaB
MLSKSTMMVGIFALLAGLGAAYGVRSYMLQEKETPPPAAEAKQPSLLKFPLASEPLPADRVVRTGDIALVQMTREQFDARFKDVNPEEVLTSGRSIVGRRLKEPLKQGQPFLTTKFYLEGTGPSISAKLQPGYRAIRVQVPDTREAGVQTGMYVDVFFRANPSPAKAGKPAIPEKTLTLLRHIEVIAAERPAGSKRGAGTKPLLFTLAVPEEKVDMFGVIEGRGELWLVPTSGKDKKNPEGAGAEVANASTLAELLGIRPIEKSKPVPPLETAVYRRCRMEINHFVDGKFVANYRVPRALSAADDAGVSSPAVPPKPEAQAPAAPPAPEQP